MPNAPDSAAWGCALCLLLVISLVFTHTCVSFYASGADGGTNLRTVLIDEGVPLSAGAKAVRTSTSSSSTCQQTSLPAQIDAQTSNNLNYFPARIRRIIEYANRNLHFRSLFKCTELLCRFQRIQLSSIAFISRLRNVGPSALSPRFGDGATPPSITTANYNNCPPDNNGSGSLQTLQPDEPQQFRSHTQTQTTS